MSFVTALQVVVRMAVPILFKLVSTGRRRRVGHS